MKKKDIIKSKFEYTNIINNKKFVKNSFFVVYFVEKRMLNNRYGISVPKKVGKANQRNKLKRRLKNIIDTNRNAIQKSYDYVIIFRKKAIELDYCHLEKKFITLINKIGEFNEK